LEYYLEIDQNKMNLINKEIEEIQQMGLFSTSIRSTNQDSEQLSEYEIELIKRIKERNCNTYDVF
jgi:uncharacterized protein YPO0396